MHAPPSPRLRVAGILILAAAIVCIGVITLTPASGTSRLSFWCFRCGSRMGVDLLLNVLLFVPLGIGLGMLRLHAGRALVAILATTAVIEALQYTVVPGRFPSLRDIVANTIGGLAGWQIAVAWHTLISPSRRAAIALSLVAAAVFLGGHTFASWAVGADLPPEAYWAQLRNQSRSFRDRFRGEILDASAGTLTTNYNDRIAESERVRREMLGGAPLRVVVTGAEPTIGAAPIFLLGVPDRYSEAAALVQNGADAFFRIRTRAAGAGLRNPGVRLSGAFSAGGARDTIELTGSYLDGRYRIRATRRGETRMREVAASGSWAWALLTPIPQYAMGAELRWASAAWLMFWFGLVAYWGAHAAKRPNGTGDWRFGAALLGVLALACFAVAHAALGLPVAHWSEWLAAALGSLGGWALGRARRHEGAAVDRN